MRILFKIFPQESHFNASIALARDFQRLGWEVVYAAYEEMRGSVESQGFKFWAQTKDVLPKLAPDQVALRRRDIAKIWIRNWLMHTRNTPDAIPSDCFDHLVEVTRPDVILVDSPYARYSVALLKHRIPFAVLESMVRLDKRRGIPPLNSAYVPNGSWASILVCEFLWLRYRLKVAALKLVYTYQLPSRKHINRVLRENGTPTVTIDYKRYFHVGVTSVPECLLSPRSFDFPGEPAKNQIYLSSAIVSPRSDPDCDYFYPERIAPFLEKRKLGTPLVYCSLGTASWRYRGVKRFFSELFKAAAGAQFSLVVALGNEIDPRVYSPMPSNVCVFQRLPQQALLHQVDLMITHGGMNTVSECIRAEVPMLVYPGTDELDQPGNAARVVFHGIGLKGVLRKENADDLKIKIEEVLQNPVYRARIQALALKDWVSRSNEGASVLLNSLLPETPRNG